MLTNDRSRLKLLLGSLIVLTIVIIVWIKKPPLNNSKASDTLNVIVLTPETGPAGSYAKYSRMGFDLGISTVEERTAVKLKVRYVDTRSNPKDGLSALQQALVTGGDPDVVISLLSSVTKAVFPVLEAKGIPVVANAVAAPGLSKPDQGLFRVFPTSDEVSSLAVAKAVELGAENAIIVFLNDEYGLGCKKTFSDHAKASDLSVSAMESFGILQKDFRVEWKKLLRNNPDLLFVAGYGPGYVTVLQHLAELEYTGHIITDFTLTAPLVVEAVAGLSSNTYVVTPRVSNEFSGRAVSQFPNAAYFVNITTAHDAMVLIAEAKMHVDSGKSSSIKNALQKVSCTLGSYGEITFNEKGDVDIPMQVVTLKDIRKELEGMQ